MNETREVVSEVPTDVQAPRFYQHTLYILGVVALCCVIGAFALAMLGKEGADGLLAIAASIVGWIGGLFRTNRGA